VSFGITGGGGGGSISELTSFFAGAASGTFDAMNQRWKLRGEEGVANVRDQRLKYALFLDLAADVRLFDRRA
jgi:hypothetical protein